MKPENSRPENVKPETPTERSMWKPDERKPIKKMTLQEINEKYVRGEQRIITEANREKLPNFVEALKRPNYMDLRPFYQRRTRWDPERQSRLIESFIINVPVPPIFLYERELNSYEVMDGQQRITAIKDFYDNQYELTGLELWPELNGMRYNDLPAKVKAGIDRRSISSVVLLKESAPHDEEAILLRQLVFERLNTGGIKLEKQEIRNALYKGVLNDLLLKLSTTPEFRTAWNLPLYSTDERENPKSPINSMTFFQKMEDLELILRFFALRHVEHYRRGMQGFLDLYMVRSLSFNESDIAFLEQLFTRVVTLAVDLYGDLAFRPYDPEAGSWFDKPQKAFYDAVMVGLSRYLNRSQDLIDRRDRIVEATQRLFEVHEAGTFTGRRNTKKDVEDRIGFFDEMVRGVLAD